MAGATMYYVRQAVGDDTHNGLSAATAWQHLAKLSAAMRDGDTAYVGPGLYREAVQINKAAGAARLTLIADTTGRYTGDPPGTVMVAGTEAVDENIFTPHPAPGVYVAPFAAYPVLGVVEMDGTQSRYTAAADTKEHIVDKLSELDAVLKSPSSFWYDQRAKRLYLHTSDGQAPTRHEIEFIRRRSGISIVGARATVVGFTLRHTRFAGISFFNTADGMAIDNVSYGNHQGIDVRHSSSIALFGNTLFRNENCGAYFTSGSSGSVAAANLAYENVNGLRWSQSVGGAGLDNQLFDNHQRGISLEHADHTVLRHNRLANNEESQLFVMHSTYSADENCFVNGRPEQLTAALFFGFGERYKTLAEYQRGRRQDLNSRDDGCGPLPAKLDVHKLHAETMAYAERARLLLHGPPGTKEHR